MSETIRFIVRVKAAPVLTRALDETIGVAGARFDAAVPEWVSERLRGALALVGP